jgi:hypothetical protein
MEIIIGAIVSLIVQFVKGKNSQYVTLAILAVLSLAAAGLYTVLVDTGYWDAVYGILVTAGAFYAFVIQRFEGGTLFSPEELER